MQLIAGQPKITPIAKTIITPAPEISSMSISFLLLEETTHTLSVDSSLPNGLFYLFDSHALLTHLVDLMSQYEIADPCKKETEKTNQDNHAH